MRYRFRVRTLMVLVLVAGLVFAGVKGWFAKRETLTLTIDWRDQHYSPEPSDVNVDGHLGGNVRLEIKDLERDEDGCVAGFTVCEQRVKVRLPQGKYPVGPIRNSAPVSIRWAALPGAIG
jgi:hypothetical protein